MFDLDEYQTAMVREILARKHLLIVAPMGAGKTLSTLVALSALIVREKLQNVLVIAPKRVAMSVWEQEAEKFDIPLNIRYCETGLDVKLFLVEPAPHRIAVCSVTRIDELPHKCWDVVVIDESTLFKHKKSLRSKQARRICNAVPRRIELSGTPVHNGYEGLWHQLFLLDGGGALGKTLTEFRTRYMRLKYKVNAVVSTYEVNPLAVPQLMRDAKPLIYVVKDNVKLPDILYKDLVVDMPPNAAAAYHRFAATAVYEDIISFSSSALGMKLRQFASGCMYTDDKRDAYSLVHQAKMEALISLRESYTGGMLVAYSFLSECREVMKQIKGARRLETAQDIADWNAKKIETALVHPASIGHGLNLQTGGSLLVWLSLTYDAELYSQLNKRLHRRGQTDTVSIVHLVARNTIDEKILTVLQRKQETAKRFGSPQ